MQISTKIHEQDYSPLSDQYIQKNTKGAYLYSNTINRGSSLMFSDVRTARETEFSNRQSQALSNWFHSTWINGSPAAQGSGYLLSGDVWPPLRNTFRETDARSARSPTASQHWPPSTSRSVFHLINCSLAFCGSELLHNIMISHVAATRIEFMD